MAPSNFWYQDTQDRQRDISPARSCTLEPDVDDVREDVRNGLVIIDLTSDISSSHPLGFRRTSVHQQPRIEYHIGDVLEVRDTMLDRYPVHFIKVTGISHRPTEGQIFEGLPFIRTRYMTGQLPKKHNEICMMLHFRRDSLLPPDDRPALANVKAELVVRRRDMITTNSLYPKFTVRRQPQAPIARTPEQLVETEANSTLVCRWKWTATFVGNHRQTKIDEEAIERINAEEVSESQFMVPEQTLCNSWRGGRHRGGSVSVSDLIREGGYPRPVTR
ncbi:hypothetical protein E4U53_005864 [Claviceps sorghi]|nr:hypothetical protein E4U53_005864 [Claviceps sorghi]